MIDWVHVNDLRAEMGDGFAELVDVFLEEMDGAVASLDPAVPPAQIAARLHFLKGAALNLGFHAFASLCDQGEISAGRSETVALTPVRDAYLRSRAAFLSGVGLAAAREDCGEGSDPFRQGNLPAFRPA